MILNGNEGTILKTCCFDEFTDNEGRDFYQTIDGCDEGRASAIAMSTQ